MKRYTAILLLVGCAQNVEPFQQLGQDQVQSTSPPTDQRPVIIFWNGHSYPNGPASIRMISSELIEAAQKGDEETVRNLLGEAIKTFAGVDDPARGGEVVGSESEIADERFASATSETTVPAGTYSQSVVLNFFNTSDASTSGDQSGESTQSTEARQDVKAAIEVAVQAALQAQSNQGGGGVGGTGSATGGTMDLDSVIQAIKADPKVAVKLIEALRDVAPEMFKPTTVPVQ